MKSLKLFTFIFALFFIQSARALDISNFQKHLTDKIVSQTFLDPKEQTFCVKGPDFEFAQNGAKQIVPASVAKIYTTNFVLEKLDKNIVFETKLRIIKNVLYIKSEGDPTFSEKELLDFLLKEKLKNPKLKINKIVYDKNFIYDFSFDKKSLENNLQKFIDKNKESKEDYFDKKVKIVKVYKTLIGKNFTVYKSPKLLEIIKEMNEYSNNSIAVNLLNKVGGPNMMMNNLRKKYDVNAQQMFFRNGSGLLGNYTTCDLTIKVLENINKNAKAKNFEIANVFDSPGKENTAMRNILKDYKYDGKIYAKNGYLYGYNTIAGVYENNGKKVFFAVFLNYANANDYQKGISTIDEMLKIIINNN